MFSDSNARDCEGAVHVQLAYIGQAAAFSTTQAYNTTSPSAVTYVSTYHVIAYKFTALQAAVLPGGSQVDRVQVVGMWIVFVYGVAAVFFVFSIMAVELGLIGLMAVSACFSWLWRRARGVSPRPTARHTRSSTYHEALCWDSACW